MKKLVTWLTVLAFTGAMSGCGGGGGGSSTPAAVTGVAMPSKIATVTPTN